MLLLCITQRLHSVSRICGLSLIMHSADCLSLSFPPCSGYTTVTFPCRMGLVEALSAPAVSSVYLIYGIGRVDRVWAGQGEPTPSRHGGTGVALGWYRCSDKRSSSADPLSSHYPPTQQQAQAQHNAQTKECVI